MKRNQLLTSFIHFVNTYSIWVALGSFSTYLFFCKIYEGAPNFIIATGLSLGVWFIYTLDHLLDGIQLKGAAATRRHATHFAQQKRLKMLLVIVAVLLVTLAFFVPEGYYKFVGILMVLTLIHFTINYLVPQRLKRMLFLKEVYIAMVVALGFGYTPFLEVAEKWAFGDIKPFLAVLFFMNLANLILFSMFDKEADEKTETLSIARFYSTRFLQFVVVGSILLSVFFTLILWFGSQLPTSAFLMMFLMQCTLLCICLFPRYFGKEDRYRFYGDLVYVLPLIVLPFL